MVVRSARGAGGGWGTRGVHYGQTASDGGGGDADGGDGGGVSWGAGVSVGQKRWDVWAAATREVWTCQDDGGGAGVETDTGYTRGHARVYTTGEQSAAVVGAAAAAAAAAADCWLRRAGTAYRATEWVRWVSPKAMVPEPGEWLDRRLRSSCGLN